MDFAYKLLKLISELVLILTIASFIILITDLKNIGNITLHSWLITPTLIISFFIIHKWCAKKITKNSQEEKPLI